MSLNKRTLVEMLRFQRVQPHPTCNRPRRKKVFQAGQLDFPRNIMRPSNVIHSVLGSALPHCAPPQLRQVQMESRHVLIHITLNPYPTRIRDKNSYTADISTLEHTAHSGHLYLGVRHPPKIYPPPLPEHPTERIVRHQT